MWRLFVAYVRAYIPHRIIDVAVDHQQVQEAIQIGIKEEAPEAQTTA